MEKLHMAFDVKKLAREIHFEKISNMLRWVLSTELNFYPSDCGSVVLSTTVKLLA